jgi:hypothetical protein
MTTTNFVDKQTVIQADWLNDVDAATYRGAAVYTPAGTGAVATTMQVKLRESVSVKDFGAVGDGVTDDTVAIQAEIFIPHGVYKFSSLTISSPITIVGEGWNITSSDYFGSIQWANTAWVSGTILRSTITTGTAITFDSATIQPYRIKGVCVIGSGSGTPTGIKLGTATHASVYCRFEDVMVCNFYTGYDLNYTFEAKFNIRTRGCYNGISISNAVNNCTFDDYGVESSQGVALMLVSSAQNNFIQGTFQGCTGAHVIRIDRNCETNTFNGGWFENNTATKGIHIGYDDATGKTTFTAATFIGWRASDINQFYVDYSYGTLITGTKMLAGSITITANAIGTNLISVSSGVSDSGSHTLLSDQLGGLNIGNGGLVLGTNSLGRSRLSMAITTTPAAPATGGTLFMYDSGGKARLGVRFPTGGVILIAAEV